MTISERIFSRLEELRMTQRSFSEQTGISQSTISEWKSKKTNPTSEKIMVICHVLEVSPEWLLSGASGESSRGSSLNLIVVDKESDAGYMINKYNHLDRDMRARLMGYMDALSEQLAKK